MRAGDLLSGRYEVVRLVGRGSSGAVHLGRDRQGGGDVAIKLLENSNPLSIERFRREAQVLEALRHPHVAQFLDHGWDDRGQPYIVQQWVAGHTLAARIDDGMTAREALAMTHQVALGLGAAHRIGVVHRDIKPSNIIRDDRGGWRLIDFGVAHVIGDELRLTRSGALVGTLAYMSPEQAVPERNIDARADVFSLGCVLYEALSGRRAFAATDRAALRSSILVADPTPLGRLRPDLPAEVRELVEQMMCKQRAGRPADGDELVLRIARLPADLPDGRTAAGAAGCAVTTGIDEVVGGDLVTVLLSAPLVQVDGARLEERASELYRILAGFAGEGTVLHDGAVVYRGRGDSPEATACDAARAALAIVARVPDLAIVLASAWTADRLPATLDSAAATLQGDTIGHIFAAAAGGRASGAGRVRADELTARLIGDRFVVVDDAGGARIVSER